MRDIVIQTLENISKRMNPSTLQVTIGLDELTILESLIPPPQRKREPANGLMSWEARRSEEEK